MRSGNDGKNGNPVDASQLVGRSPKIAQVARMIERVAHTDIPILICGESGTGKDVVAQVIHSHSTRRSEPFLKVNCAAIPHDLLESELFGYERGSFTGAYNSKPGKFELAHRGTIFLDELSEMSLSVQPKLLQVLQDKQFSRLGAHQEIIVDVRFITSTNQTPERLLAEGRFREDLYYRLNVVTIQLPPLRERREDIPDLVRHLIRKHAAESRDGDIYLSDSLLDLFLEYDWPGNVRELENVIRRLLAMGEESAIVDYFPSKSSKEPPDSFGPREMEQEFSVVPLKEAARLAARQAERDMILLALRKTNWNRKRAAELLQISYKAMLYKLKDNGLGKRSRAAFSV